MMKVFAVTATLVLIAHCSFAVVDELEAEAWALRQFPIGWSGPGPFSWLYPTLPPVPHTYAVAYEPYAVSTVDGLRVPTWPPHRSWWPARLHRAHGWLRDD
ncbi:hypothetical protein V5799_003121 [Amblyomma americanum]|uniref:Secreted protein n=1 Tax=Amblyomma americanum TaxID=6943 RepID=A0AAQ4D9V4_AMBAM